YCCRLSVFRGHDPDLIKINQVMSPKKKGTVLFFLIGEAEFTCKLAGKELKTKEQRLITKARGAVDG
ncbi:MAG: hypothetical protein U9N37_04610, partial [Thermodesulfobacteriota bacterium]|nr:hypothetical protein [Thermodesulfobacteriota bacterium]